MHRMDSQFFSSGERNRDSLGTMRLLLVGVISLGIGFSATAQEMPGVAVGKSAPTFQARDQFGKEQTISSLMGRNGLVLVFFRSADW